MVSTTNLLLGQQEEKLTLEYRDIAEGLEHLNEKFRNILLKITGLCINLKQRGNLT